MNDRQHYVFLREGDVIQEGDIYLYGDKFETAILSHGIKIQNGAIAMRPVPSAQPTETCKWKYEKIMGMKNPHTRECVDINDELELIYCFTCGKRIEVVK